MGGGMRDGAGLGSKSVLTGTQADAGITRPWGVLFQQESTSSHDARWHGDGGQPNGGLWVGHRNGLGQGGREAPGCRDEFGAERGELLRAAAGAVCESGSYIGRSRARTWKSRMLASRNSARASTAFKAARLVESAPREPPRPAMFTEGARLFFIRRPTGRKG